MPEGARLALLALAWAAVAGGVLSGCWLAAGAGLAVIWAVY